MTTEEAIYCLKSYQPDSPDNMCINCKFYGSVPIGDNVFVCESDTARAIAISALEEQKRMRGRWIPVTNGRGGFECDQCHNYAPSYQDGVEWLSDFCPSCGARMVRGEQDE